MNIDNYIDHIYGDVCEVFLLELGGNLVIDKTIRENTLLFIRDLNVWLLVICFFEEIAVDQVLCPLKVISCNGESSLKFVINELCEDSSVLVMRFGAINFEYQERMMLSFSLIWYI